MKPSILQRLRARLAVSRHKKKQGVAILTVLAIITLMTVLVVSFFNMAQNAKVTAQGSVEIQRVTTLRDTIINLVIAQFREASRLTPTGGSKDARDIITWISQPGAIRTFSGNPSDFSANRLYKLYSSNEPQIEGIRPLDTENLLEKINQDNVADWAERPDEFTDLNRPVYTAATGDRARATGATDSTGYSFPIVDPRAYNGQNGFSDREKNTEGFTYSDRSRGLRIRGVDPRLEQLAMPVRWIYLLQDGTLGYLDSSQEFRSLNGASGGEASRENPIVGRLAWWADDESSKVNVNTASIPAAWDTPRTTSLEDQWMAQNQPISGEFQRYPGHPATVDLSAVFYPNRRWVPTPLANILGSNAAGGGMTLLKVDDARRIWDLAPFIVGEQAELATGSPGTGSGEFSTPNDAVVGSSSDDRLFTSMDEVYFKASGSRNRSLNAPRSNLLSENKDKNGDFLTRLERSQFFLTHKSHSPELTNQGFPRVSMFPMDLQAVTALNSASGSLPTGVSPYDVTMALNSTIGGRSNIPGGNAYFFQRRDPGSRHNEFYNGGDSRQRNTKVFTYLKELSKLPIPGYPEAIPFKVGSVQSEDPTGLALASKYPPAVSGAGNKVWSNAFGTNGLTDASERTQILLNMLDFTRSLNMQPAFLTGADRYDDGFGKAAGVCGCANAAGADTNATHWNSLLFTNQTSRTPKGTGKLYGPAEFALVVNVAAKWEGGSAPTTTLWNQLLGQMHPDSRNRATSDKPGTRYAVEVGVIMCGFNPKQGWSASFPLGGVGISGAAGGSSNVVLSPDNAVTAILGPDAEPMRVHAGNQKGANTTHRMPRGPGSSDALIPLGGMGGPRALMTPTSSGNNFARLRPMCIIDINGNDQAVSTQLVCDPSTPLRVMPMDGGENYDVVAAVDLSLPTNFLSGGKPPALTNESLNTLVQKWALGQTSFPDSRVMLRSFVLPHGDYRLSVTPSRVDADVFVPQFNYTNSAFSHSFMEHNTNPSQRALLGASFNPGVGGAGMGMIDTNLVRNYVVPRAGNTNAERWTGWPLPNADPGRVGPKSITSIGNIPLTTVDEKVVLMASRDVTRRNTFAHGRRDGHNLSPMRGSSDPTETGDYDTGVAATPDGPYMNYPDEGDRRRSMPDAYFKKLNLSAPKPTSEGLSGQNISPNFLIRSPVDFGSIPSGVTNRVPWQTLRFRPDYGMNDPNKQMANLGDEPPLGMPFANFCGPKDHFFLDMFWMPVVEPWSISEPFSTKGTINLNQQILPFMYIERTTALYALLRGERMYAIPNDAADRYKNVSPSTGEPAGTQDNTYRKFINPMETVRQFTRRYTEGRDSDPSPPDGNQLAFNVFRSASEICEIWLVPENETPTSNENTLETTIGIESGGRVENFWTNHRLTGDNLRERPYSNLYPRVTVRSNVFKLHLVAQTLQKAKSTGPATFNSIEDTITAEWRGSCMIERSIDPRDPLLTNKDYTRLVALKLDDNVVPKLDRFYTYRVTEVKQLTQ